MNSREFSYWLQGVFEVANPKTLDENQVDLIKRHLNMVFIHEIDGSYPAEQQDALNKAHNGGSFVAPAAVVAPTPYAPVMRC